MTTGHFDHTRTPLRIGKVHLRVRDLERASNFYRRVIGLSVLDRSAGRITLGAGPLPLLLLLGDPAAAPRNPLDAGLFHIAFLLPTRADLGRWLAHAMRGGVQLQGASDHIVSEALYLSDPEGNGIEVYADRQVSHWHGPDGAIRMGTRPLDRSNLLAAAGGDWSGFPEGGSIGHVHLQVGDTAKAESFYRDILGFDISSRVPGASFFGSGGYHHHLAGNTWNSQCAGLRPRGAAGLEAVEILPGDPAGRDAILARGESAGIPVDTTGAAPALRDPWGTRMILVC